MSFLLVNANCCFCLGVDLVCLSCFSVLSLLTSGVFDFVFWFVFLLVDLALVAGGLGGLFNCLLGGDTRRCVISLGGDGFEDAKGSFVGDCLCHSGPRVMSPIVYVRCFGVCFGCSGLSLGLFRVLPFGGLVPRFGRVIILSIFGFM